MHKRTGVPRRSPSFLKHMPWRRSNYNLKHDFHGSSEAVGRHNQLVAEGVEDNRGQLFEEYRLLDYGQRSFEEYESHGKRTFREYQESDFDDISLQPELDFDSLDDEVRDDLLLGFRVIFISLSPMRTDFPCILHVVLGRV